MKLFEKNVGGIDRIVRLALGLALLGAGYIFVAAPLSYVVMLLGLVLLLTGIMRTCLLYNLVGVNTAEKKPEKKK